MFDSNKKYTIEVYNLSFMVIDEEDNILSHPDGQTMEFTIPNYDCSYLGDGVDVNDLVLRQPNSTQKWTHDFNFVFTVNTHQSDPDEISPEKIANALLETIQNMDRQEMFERSECYNSFVEDEPLTIMPCKNGVGEWEIHPTHETFDTRKEAEARLSQMLETRK